MLISTLAPSISPRLTSNNWTDMHVSTSNKYLACWRAAFPSVSTNLSKSIEVPGGQQRERKTPLPVWSGGLRPLVDVTNSWLESQTVRSHNTAKTNKKHGYSSKNTERMRHLKLKMSPVLQSLTLEWTSDQLSHLEGASCVKKKKKKLYPSKMVYKCCFLQSNISVTANTVPHSTWKNF